MAVTAGLSLLMLMTLPVAAEIRTVYYDNNGGTLTLKPNYPEIIYNITWNYNGYHLTEYLTEFDYLPVEFRGKFRLRGNLDLITGTLTLFSMTKADGGLFTVEINRDPLITFNAVGINNLADYPVEVSVMPKGCNNQTSNNCTLVCGEQFKGAEPVQYFWKEGKTGEWKMGNKTLSIVFTEDTKELSDYSCKVKNPISKKQSKRQSDPEDNQNPLDGSSGPDPMPAVLLVAVFAIRAAVVV